MCQHCRRNWRAHNTQTDCCKEKTGAGGRGRGGATGDGGGFFCLLLLPVEGRGTGKKERRGGGIARQRDDTRVIHTCWLGQKFAVSFAAQFGKFKNILKRSFLVVCAWRANKLLVRLGNVGNRLPSFLLARSVSHGPRATADQGRKEGGRSDLAWKWEGKK